MEDGRNKKGERRQQSSDYSTSFSLSLSLNYLLYLSSILHPRIKSLPLIHSQFFFCHITSSFTHLYGCCCRVVYKHCEALVHSSVLPRLSSRLSSSPRTQRERHAEAAVGRALTWHSEEPHPRHDLLQVQTSSAGLPHWFLTDRKIRVIANG